MKKFALVLALLLSLCLLVACGKTQEEDTGKADSSDPSIETNSPDAPSGETEGDAADALEAVYAQQIQRYFTAISEQWNEGAYFDNEMSAMVSYYYEGIALENVGYTFVDLDNDGSRELVIGAIKNAERDPLVFEIWTLKDGAPVMLVQSGSRNRYYVRYAAEDELWSVAYEGENGAANHAVYYLQLTEGKLEVTQGVIFDAAANENEPWFMACDLDWDVSNDTPIDGDTANAVMEAGRNIYTALEYRPYSQHK